MILGPFTFVFFLVYLFACLLIGVLVLLIIFPLEMGFFHGFTKEKEPVEQKVRLKRKNHQSWKILVRISSLSLSCFCCQINVMSFGHLGFVGV
jgi:hypothetical protein